MHLVLKGTFCPGIAGRWRSSQAEGRSNLARLGIRSGDSSALASWGHEREQSYRCPVGARGYEDGVDEKRVLIHV